MGLYCETPCLVGFLLQPFGFGFVGFFLLQPFGFGLVGFILQPFGFGYVGFVGLRLNLKKIYT